MKAALNPINLQALGLSLQQQLQTQLSQAVPMQVQCAIKQGILLVLVQHSPGSRPQPNAVFAILEQALQVEPPNLATTDFTNQVRLYLRTIGQAQPYATHSFAIEPAIAPTTFIQPETTALDAEDEDELEADVEPVDRAGTPLEDEEDNPFALALPPLTDEPGELVPVSNRAARHNSLPLMILGAGVGLFALATGMYALTRPCVVGGCSAIATAQQLSQTSAQTLQQAKSGQDIKTAQQQLQDAIATLKPIPAWSSHHSQATSLSQSYQQQEAAIAQVVTAQNQAFTAAKKSQNPPHPLPDWVEVQGLWRNAIAQLESVPRDSTAYTYAQKKRQEYQVNLVAANKRLQVERAANTKLDRAKTTAKMAAAREGIAQSVESWQLAYATWQTSINQLRLIPKGTMAHEDAQQLIAAYQPRLIAARDRSTQEQIAANAYNQAIAFAEDAQSFEQQNQWTQAVANWRNALTYAKQVPTNTLYYQDAQPLVSKYNTALTDAENQLRLADIVEGARADLRRTCAGSPRICDFSVTIDLIKVNLNPDYVRTLVRTAITAEANGDISTQVDVREHLSTLEAALKAISQNSHIPIELYDENGSLMGRSVPLF